MTDLINRIGWAAKAAQIDKPGPTSTWHWATVTDTNPVRVIRDGDTVDTPVHTSLVGGLLSGQRVWCQLYGRRIIVHGAATQPIVQAGSVQVTASGGIGTAAVTFPVTFPGTPIITVSGQSGVAALSNVQFDAPSATGFTMVMQRSSSTETTCTWIAVWTPTP